jgi:hypothetical protein
VIRPLHDALLEDLLDGVEAAVAGRRPARAPLPARIRGRRAVLERLSSVGRPLLAGS